MPAPRRRRPRGHIRELPSGSFQVIVYAGTDPLTKKPRYIRETLKTYGAAEVALTRLQGQVDQNRHRRPTSRSARQSAAGSTSRNSRTPHATATRTWCGSTSLRRSATTPPGSWTPSYSKASTHDCCAAATSAAAGVAQVIWRSLSHRYRRLAIKLGLRSTRLHSLRHYSATELIAAGVDVRTVAGRLGHGSGGATTLKIYAAWLDEEDRRAATTMAGIMPAPAATPRAPRGPYEVIAAELRERIVTGRLRAGDQLPTIAELATQHGVAAGTVHRAIDLLRFDGLVDTARGRRSLVVFPAP